MRTALSRRAPLAGAGAGLFGGGLLGVEALGIGTPPPPKGLDPPPFGKDTPPPFPPFCGTTKALEKTLAIGMERNHWPAIIAIIP